MLMSVENGPPPTKRRLMNPIHGEEFHVRQARNRFKDVLHRLAAEADSFNPRQRFDDGESTDSADSEIDKEFFGQGRSSSSSGFEKKRKGKNKSSFDGRGSRSSHFLLPFLSPQTQTPSLVYRLFDRSIDIGRFDESSPLYPIARAWLQNKPLLRIPARQEAENENEDVTAVGVWDMNVFDLGEIETTTEEVYKLPPPKPLPRDENGNLIRIRVPNLTLHRNDENELFDINCDDADELSPADLFKSDLDRWKMVRKNWMDAATKNAKRFETNFAIIRRTHAKEENLKS